MSRIGRFALVCLACGGAVLVLGRAIGRARLPADGSEPVSFGLDVMVMTFGGTAVFLVGLVAAILTLFPGLSR